MGARWPKLTVGRAGAAGRDTRGMLRQHQFEKVEMVSITDAAAGLDEHARMTGCAEAVLEAAIDEHVGVEDRQHRERRLDRPRRSEQVAGGRLGGAHRDRADGIAEQAAHGAEEVGGVGGALVQVLTAPVAVARDAGGGGDQRYFHVEVLYRGAEVADVSFDVPESEAPDTLVRLWKDKARQE